MGAFFQDFISNLLLIKTNSFRNSCIRRLILAACWILVHSYLICSVIECAYLFFNFFFIKVFLAPCFESSVTLNETLLQTSTVFTFHRVEIWEFVCLYYVKSIIANSRHKIYYFGRFRSSEFDFGKFYI